VLLDETNLGLYLAILFYIAIHFKYRFIHQHLRYFITLALLLVTFVMLFDVKVVNTLIESGHISLALFLLVMFAGVFGKKSLFYKRILLVRGDLAIIGFILLIPHAIKRLPLALYGYNFTGMIAGIIMLPLIVTSFMSIRKKMRPKNWKNLHKLAYLAYFMIYIHIGFDFSIRQSNPYIFFSDNSLFYHLLFITYLFSKSYFIIQKRVSQKSHLTS